MDSKLKIHATKPIPINFKKVKIFRIIILQCNEVKFQPIQEYKSTFSPKLADFCVRCFPFFPSLSCRPLIHLSAHPFPRRNVSQFRTSSVIRVREFPYFSHIANVTHLESLEALSGEAPPAHGLQPHDPVPQAEVALLLEVGQRAGAEEELQERGRKRDRGR